MSLRLATLGLLALLGAPVALAGPAGQPVIDEVSGTLRVAVGAGTARSRELDQDCGAGEQCQGVWRRSLTMVEGQVVLLRGVALFAELGRSTEELAEADYAGAGTGWGGGLRLSAPLPMDDWHLGGEVRLTWASTEGATLDSGVRQSASAQVHGGRLVVAWGEPREGILLFGGAEASFSWDHRVQPLGTEGQQPVVELHLRPRQGASGLAGLSLTSGKLGTEWNRSARLTSGVSGQLGTSTGVNVWVGALY